MILNAATLSPIQFEDVTDTSGITFVHSDGSSGERYIVETVASGLATFDYDGDGNIDILFLNGAPLPGKTDASTVRGCALYRNEGHWRFRDVSAASGLVDDNYHLGVCVGDYDNDGDPDIFMNNFGPNTLYRNNGDATFTDITKASGLEGGNTVGAGACFFDMEGDGDLDLFAANYVAFTFETHHTSQMNGFPAYVGPLNYPPTSNYLYRNEGDGSFKDISKESGIADLKGAGMGVIAADLDNDFDLDIVVGNDLRPDFMLQNNGKGQFKDVGAMMGLAYDAFGNVQGSMGVECSDWDHDGWLDIYITPYQRQLNTLYQNQQGRYFEDVARQTSAASDSYADVKWGVGMVDFDNDCHRDIFVACGHLIDNVDQFDTSTRYAAPNLLLRNNGQGKFVNVSAISGNGLSPTYSSRGAAFDDLDNDGDVDVVVLNARSRPTLLMNTQNTGHHWVQVQLKGTRSNRDGVGARVSVRTGDLRQIDELHSGRSYQSDFGKRLHFGLGNIDHIDEISIKWIGGQTDIVRDIPADQIITLTEGLGISPHGNTKNFP